MLTRQQALAVYDFQSGRVVPDRLTQRSHQQYRQHAERMLDIYRRGVGQTRRELHRAVEALLADEEDCPARRIGAFCKLLDDAAIYEGDRRGRAAALRRKVFRLAGARHPLVQHADGLFESEEAAVKTAIAAELGTTWEAIDRDLFADVTEFQRLVRFDGYPDGAALLARYNGSSTISSHE